MNFKDFKYFNFLIVFCITIFPLKAQQPDVFYNHYFINPVFVNPAYTGYKGNPQVMLIGKKQWTGFAGSPQFNTLLVDGKLKSKKMGVGLKVINEKYGFYSKAGGELLYSYTLKLSAKTHLSFGLSLGVNSYSYRFADAVIENAIDPILNGPSIRKSVINGGTGVSFISKNIEAGISLPQFLGRKIKYENSSFIQHPNLIFSYIKYNYPLIGDKEMYLSPLISIKNMQGSPLQYDAGVVFDWKYKFWTGVIYKNKHALSTNVGFSLYKRFSVGYSYDVIFNPLHGYSGNSHEFFANYVFGKIKTKKELDTEERQLADSLEGKKTNNLNDLLLEKLISEIDAIFENPEATEEDYVQLIEKINEFSDSYIEDPALANQLKQYVSKLEQKQKSSSQVGTVDVIVKGKIELTNKRNFLHKNYSDVSITLYDKNTGVAIGSYKPHERNGKFVLILKSGELYTVEIKKDEYKLYTKSLSPKKKKVSYEINLSVKLKKDKKKQTLSK